MPFQEVHNAVQAEMIFEAFGIRYESILNFKKTGATVDITTGDCVNIAGYVQAWAEDQLVPLLSNDVTFVEVQAKGLDLEAPAFHATASGNSGGEAQASEPLTVTACVSFRTAFSGRNFRGRNYISGLPVGFVTGNTISAGFLDDLRAAYNSILSAEPIGFNWVVVSRVVNYLVRPFGICTNVQNVAIASNRVTTMRSRAL